MNRALQAIMGLVGLSFLFSVTQTRRVVGNDMSPSIQDGDLIVLSPTSDVQPGDVVLLQDPLNSDRTVIRRVMAIGGQTITVADGHIKVGKRRLRAKAMGDMGAYLVAKETLWAKKPDIGASWLTRHQADPVTHWKADPVEVPTGQIYLIADDRDGAIDSRWWGPVSLDRVQGVVRARWGAAHTWRPTWELLAGSPPIGA